MATKTSWVAGIRPGDTGLRRELGLIGATWASVSSIIGAGWLFNALYAAQAVGGAAVLGWIIAAVMIIVLALCYAELGAMYPVTGGPARFPHFAFGSAAGIGFGFFSYMQAVTIAPVECFVATQYASYFWPGIYNATVFNVTRAGFIVTIVLMAVFVAVNFLAMRLFARVNSVITWWKVGVPVLAIIVLLGEFHGGHFTAGGQGFMPGGLKALLGALPGAGIIFAYLGFEQASQLAGEVKNPQRNVPRAILLSVLVAAGIYCLIQVVFIGAMPTDQIGKGFATITNTNILSSPVTGLASLLGLSAWLAFLLRIDSFVAAAGTGLIYTTGTSRVSYGLARNRYIPQVFGQVSRQRVPWVGLIAGYVIGVFFLLPFPSWHSLIGLVTGASVLMYAGAPLALGAFRRQIPDADRPYRMPMASVLAPVAFIIANLLIYWSGFDVVWKLGIVLVIGYVIIGAFMTFDPQRPPMKWRSSTWLPVWLLGLGIISWQGQYSGTGGVASPPTNTFNIPFWWDIVTVAVFSLVIYYWAMLVRLPREEMLDLIGRQGGES